ncbi:MAG TPA: imidazole glycerol phosphate synthase subunit HisH [Candidatus Hydrogenedens sp.]|nr:imidazole glycerol phosphate synthase subunit HisH [Candidatus Hydrogenedens sp.]HOL19001.1 imidazole glycerol phosphate synthase subunit HisH [Candidatus Hydrogenedens sp.]HPP57817.1 imidazole glycerol phosphate synthase subunit HisH [Candidatus Hydrogenedens sp.]
MILIIDYGMGNLRSAQKALEKVGLDAIISENPSDLIKADAAVLPGVGAFRDCYEGLKRKGFVEPVKEFVQTGKPLLGICIGLQLLFEYGEEGGGSEGLGIFKGGVVRFPPTETTGLKVPHMGWNFVQPVKDKTNPLLPNNSGGYAYFVHSYYPKPEDKSIILATCEYGITFPCMVGDKAVLGVQFHPEKSQQFGLNILKNFGEFIRRNKS